MLNSTEFNITVIWTYSHSHIVCRVYLKIMSVYSIHRVRAEKLFFLFHQIFIEKLWNWQSLLHSIYGRGPDHIVRSIYRKIEIVRECHSCFLRCGSMYDTLLRRRVQWITAKWDRAHNCETIVATQSNSCRIATTDCWLTLIEWIHLESKNRCRCESKWKSIFNFCLWHKCLSWPKFHIEYMCCTYSHIQCVLCSL